MARFVVGLGLVVAGGVSAGPYLTELAAAHGRSRVRAVPAVSPACVSEDGGQVAGMTGDGAVPAAGFLPTTGDPAVSASPTEVSTGPVSPPFVPRADYRPPEPPAPLPPVAAAARSTPALVAAYRSTLDAPPPPLLDADTPPPLSVAWTANGGASTPAPNAAGPRADLSSTHVVRDGDDLTGIAVRIYGHAGGAQAIWSANRDRLADPALLPIGVELRIPPAWDVPNPRQAGTGVPLIEPTRRPTLVRVAPGETLEGIALRYYRDRSMATRLFEANRDILRSPELIVAGMELRLP